MPIEMQRAWLTEETYERARSELAELLIRRAAGSFIEYSDEQQCARRIRWLQELLGDAVIGYEPPDDGIAEPGMVLTVRYEADGLTATFLMAEREEDTDVICRSARRSRRWARRSTGQRRETVASSPFAAGTL